MALQLATAAAYRPPTRVVIAEDEPAIRDVLTDLINGHHNFELVGDAHDADEAIRITLETEPDVVILDVKMPGGGGIRAAREIQHLFPAAKMLALSAYSDGETVSKMLGAGALGYIVKGATPDDIITAIDNVAHDIPAFSPEVAAYAGAVESPPQHADMQQLRRILRGEGFRIVFQPICELAGGRVIGMEALSRFDSLLGHQPIEWFRDAESAGLRPELEILAMRTALVEAEKHAPDVFLAVNLSPATLASPLFLEALPESVHQLAVEITEAAVVEYGDALVDALALFRRRGGMVAIDDWGASFATLRQILAVNPDYLKLDMEITHNLEKDRGMRALAFSMSTFALEIGATIIAEGIESQAEIDALRNLGVSCGQGYYLGWPGIWVDDIGPKPGTDF